MAILLPHGLRTHRTLLIFAFILSAVITFGIPDPIYNQLMLFIIFISLLVIQLRSLPHFDGVVFDQKLGLKFYHADQEEAVLGGSYRVFGLLCLQINHRYIILSRLDLSSKDYFRLCSAVVCSRALKT